MAPKDPINAWDLGREYDCTGETALADKWYQKGLSLMHDPDQKKRATAFTRDSLRRNSTTARAPAPWKAKLRGRHPNRLRPALTDKNLLASGGPDLSDLTTDY